MCWTGKLGSAIEIGGHVIAWLLTWPQKVLILIASTSNKSHLSLSAKRISYDEAKYSCTLCEYIAALADSETQMS